MASRPFQAQIKTGGATLFGLIRREVDGLFYDTDDSTFKAYGSISGSDAQVSMTEDSDAGGFYESASITFTTWDNGPYSFIMYVTTVSAANAKGSLGFAIQGGIMFDDVPSTSQLGDLWKITVTVEDGDAVAIPDATVHLKNAGQTKTLAIDTTDANGQVLFYLQDGSYKILTSLLGQYSFSETTLTVAGVAQSVTITGSALSTVDAATDANFCRVSGYVKDFAGNLLGGVKVAIRVEGRARVGNTVYQNPHRTVTSAAVTGLFSFDALRPDSIDEGSLVYRVAVPNAGFDVKLTIPNQANTDIGSITYE